MIALLLLFLLIIIIVNRIVNDKYGRAPRVVARQLKYNKKCNSYACTVVI
jgi:hypothetical protein